MIDYSREVRTGTRTRDDWLKIGNNWTKTSTVTTQILSRHVAFTCTNGTGGDPSRKLATNYSFSKTQTTWGQGTHFTGNPAGSYSEFKGNINGTSMNPSISTPSLNGQFTDLQNRALERLAKKTRSDLDLAIDLLEGRQTARLLAAAARTYSYILSFSPKRWAQKWLEFQYGWRPLVNSVYGIAREMTTPPREGDVCYKERVREVLAQTVRTNSGGIQDSCQSVLHKRCEYQISLSFKANTIEQLSRISSLNPASIAWELCPYSFVADWFVNVGGYLRLMETAYLNDLIFLGGHTSTGSLRLDTYKRFGYQDLGAGSYSLYGGAERITRTTTKSRSRLTSYPMPMFPSLKVDLGSERILSGAALLTQFFAKAKR